jgi:hypothetical protein
MDDLIGIIIAIIIAAVIFWLLSYVNTLIAALVALAVFLLMVFGGGSRWVGGRFGGWGGRSRYGPRP